jgi:hypothetical protein
MYTKEEMIMFPGCAGWVRCGDCPFEKINAGLLFKPDCYKENVSQYKKEKEMEENKPSHPFKVGVKYFTRDKKSWRRFIGENLDVVDNVYSVLWFTDVDGRMTSRTIDGTAQGLQSSSVDVLPEEWKEPTPEPKFEKKTFYRPSVYSSDCGLIDDDYKWELDKSKFRIKDDLEEGDHIIWEERIFEIPVEEK